MFFASDNTGPAHPRVIEALTRANEGHAMPYGDDAIMKALAARIREVFEAPEAVVHMVTTGTAANSLILATLATPWQTVFCTPEAHIHEDECNAPEFFTGGAKLTLVPGLNAKMQPDALHRAIEAEETRGVHGPQRGPVSITNITERGTIYSPDEQKALADTARRYDLPVHLDGARLANAIARLNCTPAEITWKSGIDAVSLGGTKNGLLGAEAVIFFDPANSWEFELRRKRAGHLPSKNRYLAVQMLAHLENGLWLECARQANSAAARLARGLKQITDVSLLFEPEANMIFAKFPRATHQRLHAAGAQYYVWEGSLEGEDPQEMLTARLVCDWSVRDEDITRFLTLAQGS